jgi:hypothetical protein
MEQQENLLQDRGYALKLDQYVDDQIERIKKTIEFGYPPPKTKK